MSVVDLGPAAASDQAVPDTRLSYRSDDELAIREAVDVWGRAKWPSARVVHEIVVDRGKTRADMAFVSPDHFVTIEIKSRLDSADRLWQQVGTFRLASPETWIVVDKEHDRSATMLRYLLPSIGVAHAARQNPWSGPFHITEIQQPGPFQPAPASMLSILWVAELRAEAVAHRVWQGKEGRSAKLVAALLKLSPQEQVAAVCRQLRARDALWRADAPVKGEMSLC